MVKSRFDSDGFFWNDPPGYRPEILGIMPPIPDTGWQTPREFPNLSAAKAFSIDCETKDPELTEAGPGWARGVGHIVGVSLAVRNGPSWYFPIRHELEPEHNMDAATVLRWLGTQLGDNRPKIGANILYDVGWLQWEGVPIKGPYYDIQYAEALLNSETPDVSLEALSNNYLGHGKQTDLLKAWAQSYYKTGDKTWRRDIYRCPPRLVGRYAEGDASQPFAIADRQWPLLHARGVAQVFELECRLIPLLVAMRMRGAPVDVAAAEQMHERLGQELAVKAQELTDLVGFGVNPNSADDVAKAFDALGYPYPRTKAETPKPSFRQEWLEAQPHELAEKVVEWRRLAKVQGTFIKGYVLDKNINGRIYCTFHPLKGDTNGARSGRFASSDPNLQNIPVRTDIGKEIRRAFVPKDKGARWRKFDYSQIEYRLLAHHATGPGADEIRYAYNNDPTLDYHDKTIELVFQHTGYRMKRKPAKNINFGLVYGMGKPKLARAVKMPLAEAEGLFAAYHQGVPFAKPTMQACADEIDATGMIRTISGRVSDFNQWVPNQYDPEAKPLSFDYAIRAYGPDIVRSYKHKGLNRKLQGGAADVMKAAMVAAWDSGIFDYVGMPCLTVHDELDFEDTLNNPYDPAWEALRDMLENTTKLSVPIKADMGWGPNWGDSEWLPLMPG